MAKLTFDLKNNWWKLIAVILLLYTVIGGFLIKVPRIAIVQESVRNQFFHVSMWFSMMLLLTTSLIFSIRYLAKSKTKFDLLAEEFAYMGIILGILGLATGSIWARFTWGAWWVNDAKLNGAAICMLIYLAYVILRNSIEDEIQRARIGAVYNIFAWSTLLPLLYILPRLTDSLHPGSGGNPGFNIYDLDNNLRLVFYPSIIGWTLLSVWIIQLRVRVKELKSKLEDIS
ncbi:MAG: cytochrome c biogenesis protein CcsA [Cyclobacteriaceae bacterium]|jgi:heme exporter protein C